MKKFILDTNIVLIYLRENQLSRNLESSLRLMSGTNNLFLSAVSLGELKSIAKQNKWGNRKLNRMILMLRKFIVVDINLDEVIEQYAEIDTYSQGKLEGSNVNFSSRNMGKNDLWIAATASVYDLRLVTTDQDFRHLQNEYIELEEINIDDYK
ncbi:MAG: PIN domain-containing protein [Bacteroidota bacterium]